MNMKLPGLNSCLLTILVGVSATAWSSSSSAAAENNNNNISLEFDPPLAFTQYEGGCEGDGSKAVFSGQVTSVEVMRWSNFCIVDIIDGDSYYTQLDIDCNSAGLIESYYKCTDDSCSDCVLESSSKAPWSDAYPDLPEDHCYNSSYLVGGEERFSQYQYDETDNYDVVKSYIDIISDNSCIISWQPHLQDIEDGDDDPMPEEGAVQCPNAPSYCDCDTDCVEFPSYCSCDEAQSCCEGEEDKRDKDHDGILDSFIMCPGENDICDCSMDCFFNKQQCACEEAEACCSTKVNCPDSPPDDHCNCSSDCTEQPQWCTCEEGQSCCADFLSDMGDGDDDEEEDCSSILDLICDASDDHTIFCDLFSHWALDRSSEWAEGLSALLEDDNVKWTLFAPNDAAFADIDDELATMTENEIGRIVLFHAGGEAEDPNDVKMYDDLECTEVYEMVSGDTSRTKCVKDEDTGIWEKYQKGGGNQNNGSLPKIINADIMACNGVLHVLDAVMLPNFVDKFD